MCKAVPVLQKFVYFHIYTWKRKINHVNHLSNFFIPNIMVQKLIVNISCLNWHFQFKSIFFLKNVIIKISILKLLVHVLWSYWLGIQYFTILTPLGQNMQKWIRHHPVELSHFSMDPIFMIFKHASRIVSGHQYNNYELLSWLY